MRRRDLLGVVTGAAIAVATGMPDSGCAAEDKTFRVGIASLVNSRSAPQFLAFEERLRQLATAAGRDLAIEFRLLDGDADRFPAAMQELVRGHPDLILAPGQEIAAKAARAATQTIPIVVVAIDYDPVALGYVQNLARPGGNITGVYLDTIEVAAKRAQLLKEAAPDIKRLIVFWDAVGADSFKATVPAAQTLGLTVQSVELRNPPYDYEAALVTATPAPGDALLCMASPYFFHDVQQLDELAVRHRLPSMCGGVDSGGLIAYSASLNAMFRTAADYAGKILKGAKPGDLPIQQPTRFKLVVNLKVAQALGLTVPQSILGRADEVIE
ncbi:MAG TPA: ABC transporter substrate-binding protein [Stellaceae bacterium]|nr:ABC transporter substrate-binding protein [Stellaceae bacterium]